MPERGTSGPAAATVLGRSHDPAYTEAAELTDPRRLFLPTQASGLRKDLLPEQMDDSPEFAAKFAFSSNRLALQFPPPVAVPNAPEAYPELKAPGFPIEGIGRKDSRVSPLPARGGFVRVTEVGSGHLVYERPLDAGLLTFLDDGTWQTQEFLATVEPSGFVVSPAEIAHRAVPGTDFARLDREAVASIQNLLVNRLFLGQVLDPGFYRISVGP
jgi:hypothetical protein